MGVDAFRETDLRSWVHPREVFHQVLWLVFGEHGDEDVALPFELGTYTFRNPDQCPLPVNFEAVVTLVERDDGQAEDALLYFTWSSFMTPAPSASTLNNVCGSG